MIVNLLSEARDIIIKLCEVQIRLANEQNALPNKEIPGDIKVRKLILGMLDYKSQRIIYETVINSYERCERAKPLFGTPPYKFLDVEANLQYNASGFSLRRKNMAYIRPYLGLPNTHQFGSPHYIDEDGRLYRICYEYIKDEDPPMPKHYVKGVREFIQFYVKAKEQQGSKRKSLPVPGKIVNLKSTHVLDEFDGTSQQTTSIRVHTYTSNFTGGSRVIFLMTASIIL